MPLREADVGLLGTPVGCLDWAEELLLEPVGGDRAELFVGLAKGRERGGDVVDRLAERVEQLLPGFPGYVGHWSEVSRHCVVADRQLAGRMPFAARRSAVHA